MAAITMATWIHTPGTTYKALKDNTEIQDIMINIHPWTRCTQETITVTLPVTLIVIIIITMAIKMVQVTIIFIEAVQLKKDEW